MNYLEEEEEEKKIIFHSFFREAMSLADVVADETFALYECFHRDNMRNFLNKIKQSAVCQLDHQ